MAKNYLKSLTEDVNTNKISPLVESLSGIIHALLQTTKPLIADIWIINTNEDTFGRYECHH